MKLHLQKDIIFCSLWMQGNAMKAWQYNYNYCLQADAKADYEMAVLL